MVETINLYKLAMMVVLYEGHYCQQSLFNGHPTVKNSAKQARYLWASKLHNMNNFKGVLLDLLKSWENLILTLMTGDLINIYGERGRDKEIHITTERGCNFTSINKDHLLPSPYIPSNVDFHSDKEETRHNGVNFFYEVTNLLTRFT